MQGVIRRGTYNLKYAKGFAHCQHTISAAQQQQQEQKQHKHQGQQQRDSVQSTNDLFCSVFFGILLFTLVCKVLQTSCSQRPLIRQRTFTLWFSCFLSLPFLFPFLFPYPLPIADAVALTVAVAMRCLSVHCELWTRQGNKSRSVICWEAQRDVVVVFDYVWLTEKCENTSVGKRFKYMYILYRSI